MLRLEAEFFHAQGGGGRVEDAEHDLLAPKGWERADAEVDGAVLGDPHLDAAVLGHAALGDVEPGQDLDARRDTAGERERRVGDLAQHPVLAVAYAVGFFVGFDMDIGGAPVDSVEQHLVHNPDDGCVVDAFLAAGAFRRFLAAGDLHVLEVFETGIGRKRGERCVGGLKAFVDRPGELVFLDQDRFGAEPGMELDLIQRLHVGGIGNRHVQACSALEERQHSMAADDFFVDQFDRRRFEIQGTDLE